MTKNLIKAEQKYLRASPQKVKLVVDAIKKLSPVEALEHLPFIRKRAASQIARVIKQAIANAENNFKLKKENLVFKKILVKKGPTFKRWQAVSRGRAHQILKRTTHLEVVLENIKD